MLGQAQDNAMQDYIASYSDRLSQLLGYTPPASNLGGAAPGAAPMMESAPAAAPGSNLGAEPMQPGPVAPGGAPPAEMQSAPAAGPLKKNAAGKVEIQSRPSPDFDFGVKDDDLKEVKTVGDLVKKMPEKKANEYMSWWEGQYGDINAKYDAMLKEIGQRPDPRSRDLSRKDKFTLLMEFGLNLMKHSQEGGDRTGAFGAAIHDTVRGDQARRKEDFDRHRSLTNEIEGRRQKELGAIGSQGEAMVASTNLGNAISKEGREQTEFDERDDEIKQVVYGDDAVVGINRKGAGTTVRDEKGNPVRSTLGVARGSTRGAGGRNGYAPSDPEKRATFYAKVYNIPLDVAADLVRQEKVVTDPFKAYTRIVDRLTAQYYPQDEAIRIAKEIVQGVYGAETFESQPGAPLASSPMPRGPNLGGSGAPAPARSPLDTTTPPASKLKAGVVTTIKNKRSGLAEKWTLDENGQPKRVLR